MMNILSPQPSRLPNHLIGCHHQAKHFVPSIEFPSSGLCTLTDLAHNSITEYFLYCFQELKPSASGDERTKHSRWYIHMYIPQYQRDWRICTKQRYYVISSRLLTVLCCGKNTKDILQPMSVDMLVLYCD